MKARNILISIAVIVALILVVGAFKGGGGSDFTSSSILNRIQDTKIIRVGYAAYPPYVVKDEKTGELSGYYIDITKEIAKQMGVEIEWIETTWNTYISDLQTGKFDMLSDPMFSTIPRLMQIDFSAPLGYFSGVAALVKKGDNRFSRIEDLNRAGIVIAVPQNWTAEDYAKKYLTNATIRSFAAEGTAAVVLVNVPTGNADVALADGPSVQQYVEQNPNQNVKVLFLDNPTVLTAAGFGLPKGDLKWNAFINDSIQTLRVDSTLKKLAKKYHLYSYDQEVKYVPQ